MSTATIGDIVTRADVILQDNNVRWPASELLYWLNDAYRAIVMIRPDANMQSGTFACAEGTRQDLDKSPGGFPTALRLRSVVRNMAATSAKRAIRPQRREVLDDQRPGWHNETKTVDIQHSIYDPLNPKEFYVYPPATSAAEVEVVYSSVPTQHKIGDTGITDEAAIKGSTVVIRLDDIYVNPILDYILYRAYAKDADYAANAERAAAHFAAFSQALGASTQADAGMVAPDLSRSSGNHGAN